MVKHGIVCTRDNLAQTMENLMSSGATKVEAKQVDSISYVVTWETEGTENVRDGKK